MLGMTQYIRDVFNITNTDKGYEHHYEHMYATMLASFEPKSILEIGVRQGHSIRAWQRLYPRAAITGVDIKKQTLIPGPEFEYIIGDSVDPSLKLSTYDLIVDDGSHQVSDQLATFTNLKNSFSYAYVIEDIGYARPPHPSSEESTQILISAIQEMGFRGIARFNSYNTRNPCYSLVIYSQTF